MTERVVIFIGRLCIVLSPNGRFLMLGGVEHVDSTNRFQKGESQYGKTDRRGGNHHDVSFLVTADGEWLIGKPPQAERTHAQKKLARARRLSRESA